MFSTKDADEEAHLSFFIRGDHVYNAISSATVGEELQCAREVGIAKDGYSYFLHFTRFRCSGALTSKDSQN